MVLVAALLNIHRAESLAVTGPSLAVVCPFQQRCGAYRMLRNLLHTVLMSTEGYRICFTLQGQSLALQTQELFNPLKPMFKISRRQAMYCTYNVTLRCVRVTVAAVEKQ
jgi:hypothetical protein